jgi:hypothetical protein
MSPGPSPQSYTATKTNLPSIKSSNMPLDGGMNEVGGEGPKTSMRNHDVDVLRKTVDDLKAAIEGCSSGLQGLKEEVNRLRLRYDTELGRNRNILIHGFTENTSPIPHVRKKANEALVMTILRISGLLPNIRWRRVHRIGRWTRQVLSLIHI